MSLPRVFVCAAGTSEGDKLPRASPRITAPRRGPSVRAPPPFFAPARGEEGRDDVCLPFEVRAEQRVQSVEARPEARELAMHRLPVERCLAGRQPRHGLPDLRVLQEEGHRHRIEQDLQGAVEAPGRRGSRPSPARPRSWASSRFDVACARDSVRRSAVALPGRQGGHAPSPRRAPPHRRRRRGGVSARGRRRDPAVHPQPGTSWRRGGVPQTTSWRAGRGRPPRGPRSRCRSRGRAAQD